MLSIWTKHIKDDPETKAKFENEVYGSKRVLDHLKKILEDREKEVRVLELDPSTYESPSWSHLQADRNGYLRALATLKKIVDLDAQSVPTEKPDDRSLSTAKSSFPRTTRPQ